MNIELCGPRRSISRKTNLFHGFKSVLSRLPIRSCVVHETSNCMGGIPQSLRLKNIFLACEGGSLNSRILAVDSHSTKQRSLLKFEVRLCQSLNLLLQCKHEFLQHYCAVIICKLIRCNIDTNCPLKRKMLEWRFCGCGLTFSRRHRVTQLSRTGK